METGIEGLHARYFNALGLALPGLTHLHYGLAEEQDDGLWGLPRRLRAGPERLSERILTLAELPSLPPGAAALDLGCGLGGTCIALARAGLRVTGVNLTAPQVALAQERLRAAGVAERVALLRADGRALPLPDASVDLVTLIEVAFHVPEKAQLFAEIARVLRPGGRLVMADQERPAGALEVMDMFFFPAAGAYTHLATEAGLQPVAFQDLSTPVAAWMRDYALTATAPLMLALCAGQLLRGRAGIARTLWAGNRHFAGLVRQDLAGRGVRLPRGVNPLRALREHTRAELLGGASRYGLWRFDAPR